MPVCHTCGNDDRSFEVRRGGENYFVGDFECAVTASAPVCGQCDTRITGLGLESGGTCIHGVYCAQTHSEQRLRDRI